MIYAYEGSKDPSYIPNNPNYINQTWFENSLGKCKGKRKKLLDAIGDGAQHILQLAQEFPDEDLDERI